jgi:MFS family permease
MGVALGVATLSPTAPSLMADTFPPERRTLPLSLYVAAGGAGTSIGLIAGGFVSALVHEGTTVDVPILGALQPWQIICIAVSTPGLLVAILFLLLPEPVRRSAGQDNATLQELGAVLRSRWTILVPQSAAICLFQLQAFAYGSWAPAFFMRLHGWSIAEAGVRLGVAQLIMGTLGGIAAGWTARVLLRRGLRDANLVTSALFLGAMAPPAIAGFLLPDAWVSFALLALMTLFAHGPAGGSLASIMETIPNRLRGRVTAIYYASLGLVSMTFGPLIIGVMNNYIFGEQRIYLSLAVLSALTLPLGAVLLLVAGRQRRKLTWAE